MRLRIRHKRLLGFLSLQVGAALVAGTLLSAAPAFAQESPRFKLPTDSSVPVLVMRQWPTEFAESAAQELRIFADGRCTLKRPPMMRGAGDHVWTISQAEVKRLVAQGLDAGLADLDARKHRAQIRTRAAASAADGGVQSLRLDDDTVEFEIAIDDYRSPRESSPGNVRRKIEWRGLRSDRQRDPTDGSVRLLNELRDELDALGRVHAPVDAQP